MTAPGPCFCATGCSVPTVPPVATPAATLAAATLAVPPADTLAVPPPPPPRHHRRAEDFAQTHSGDTGEILWTAEAGRAAGQFAATRASGRSETGSPSAG